MNVKLIPESFTDSLDIFTAKIVTEMIWEQPGQVSNEQEHSN